jgi:phage shock protein PspC (stress-responsive transcriptional regulator)
MNCNEAVAALVASLENGTPMTDAQREHIRTCERCRELLDSAKQVQSELAGNGIQVPAVDAAVAAAEEETRKRRFRRAVRAFSALAILVTAFIFLLPDNTISTGERFFILGATALISVGFALPVIAVLKLVRGSSRHPLFKRIAPGRSMISGVSAGIAEETKVNVTLIRLVFVALLFAGGGVGFWLYLLLDVAMPVHPDDRQYLLRFRLRRWWARRNGHAEHRAG